MDIKQFLVNVIIEILQPKWVAIIISLFALIISYLSYNNAKRITHQHIKPLINVSFEYPLTVKDDQSILRANSPELTITNVGAIKIASLMVGYEGYIYDPTNKIIIGKTMLGKDKHGYLIFKD
jgi:hypothetical protein